MDLIRKVFDAGVVGAGGAGFPTHVKLKCKVEYLIVNGAECEPLLETDKYLMRTKSNELIRAIEEVGRQVEAEQIVLGLKKKYKEEIKQLQEAIQKSNAKIKLYLSDNFYPAGDEQILVYEITKRAIPAGGLPLDVNTLVVNIGTLVNIYDAMEDRPVIDKYVTVIGEVHRPCILRVPIGISVAECIAAAGGSALRTFAVAMGGPMMGRIIREDQMEDEVITKTTGALIVLPKDHYIVQRKELPVPHMINQAKTACIQCSMCTDLCPRYLIGHRLRPHRIMRSIGLSESSEEILKEALICCECGICELYACPMVLSPRNMNVYLKQELREKGIRHQKNHETPTAEPMREYRKIPIDRLIARLHLGKYKNTKVEGPFEVATSRVKIPLSQHIGKPAQPIVKVGDQVHKGQVIAEAEAEGIGARSHAGINGKVVEVSDAIVILSKKNGVIL